MHMCVCMYKFVFSRIYFFLMTSYYTHAHTGARAHTHTYIFPHIHLPGRVSSAQDCITSWRIKGVIRWVSRNSKVIGCAKGWGVLMIVNH